MKDKMKGVKRSNKGIVRAVATAGIILIILLVVIIIHTCTKTELVVKPCVDGDGDVNLEGIMCEKEVYTGILPWQLFILSWVLVIPGLIFFDKSYEYVGEKFE